MHLRPFDAVILDIVLPAVDAVADLRQQLAADGLGAVLDHPVIRRFQRLDPVAFGHRHDPVAAEPGGADLGVEIAAQMLRQPRVAGDDLEHRLVDDAALVDLDGGHHQPLGPHVGGLRRQAAGGRPADIVVMAEHLAEADQPVAVEDRQRGAQVGDMADAARAVVGVVPEEDIPGMDVAGVEILEHRLDHRRIGAPGELSAPGVEQGDAVVVLVADHRRARGPFDRRLDLQLGGADRPADDFELDRPQCRLVAAPAARGCRHACFSSTRLP